jgi:hypothetical protein
LATILMLMTEQWWACYQRALTSKKNNNALSRIKRNPSPIKWI